LHENLDKPYAFMFFYQSKEVLSYPEIEEKTIQLFEKWVVEKKS
jgi:ribonuclease P protein component